MLPDGRVFFLGSPALHYAGTDRLQMVGVRSRHVDSSSWLWHYWFLCPPDVVNIVLHPTALELRHKWDQILCSTLFLQRIYF